MSRLCTCLAALLVASPLVAAEGNPSPRSTNDRQIIDLLARVHDQGAALFNAGDHGGCYRMFQGALVTAKLVLPKELQDSVDRGLSRAEMQTDPMRKAMALHDVIEDVRKKLQPTAGKGEGLIMPKADGGSGSGVKPMVPGVPDPGKKDTNPKKDGDPGKTVSTPSNPPLLDLPKAPMFGSPEPPLAPPMPPGRINLPDAPPPVISGVPTSNPKPLKPMPEPTPVEQLPVAPRPMDPASPSKPAPKPMDDAPPLKVIPLPMDDPLAPPVNPPAKPATPSPAPPSSVPELSAPPLDLGPPAKPKSKTDSPPPLKLPGT